MGGDGTVWLTDSGQNAIARVDPKTRAVKLWKLPADSGYANLNTATFDGKGVHWFTGQSGLYGRLDPRSGEMKIFEAPRGRGPYGIHHTPDGTVYYASLAGDFVGRINPDGTTAVLEPPTRGQGARRVWSDSKGNAGSRMELRAAQPLRAGERQVVAMEGARKLAPVYARSTSTRPTRSGYRGGAQAMLRFDPQTASSTASNPEPVGQRARSTAARAVWTPEGRRQDRGLPLPVGNQSLPALSQCSAARESRSGRSARPPRARRSRRRRSTDRCRSRRAPRPGSLPWRPPSGAPGSRPASSLARRSAAGAPPGGSPVARCRARDAGGVLGEDWPETTALRQPSGA